MGNKVKQAETSQSQAFGCSVCSGEPGAKNEWKNGEGLGARKGGNKISYFLPQTPSFSRSLRSPPQTGSLEQARQKKQTNKKRKSTVQRLINGASYFVREGLYV